MVVACGRSGRWWSWRSWPSRAVRAPGSRRLPRIVLRADDAPDGTRLVEERGGSQELEATTPAERRALVADGFVRGYVVYFAPDTYFATTPPSDAELEAAVSAQVIAGLFEGIDGARSSLDRYVEDRSTRQVPGAATEPSDSSGQEAVHLEGEAPDGTAVIAYLWRVDNLALVVAGSGPIRDAVVLGLARTWTRARATPPPRPRTSEAYSGPGDSPLSVPPVESRFTRVWGTGFPEEREQPCHPEPCGRGPSRSAS